MTTGEQPLPTPSAVSAPYWQGARRHELWFQRCEVCDGAIFYPRSICPLCGSDQLSWQVSSGRGTVYSYTIVRRPTHPAFTARVPFTIAIVDLDEGFRMTTNIVGIDPADVSIGMPVRAIYEDVDEAVTLVYFESTSEKP